MSLVAGNLAYSADPAVAGNRPGVVPLVHEAVSPCRLGFFLFVLVNAVLFVRPAELIHGIDGWPIYEVVIVACLLVSLPVVIPQLAWTSLRRNLITLCVLGLLPAVILSHLSHGNTYDARMCATEFLKIVIYYLLLVGLVDSPARLRIFLLVIAVFVLCTAVLSLLNHHGVIDIPALADLKEGFSDDPDADNSNVVIRLRAMGIFNDPNDFALIINVAIFIFLHWLIRQKRWLLRIAWSVPIGVLVYAFALTQSRGGFLSLLAGLLVLLFTRIRWKRAVLISAVLVPAIFVAAAGRLTNLDVEDPEDTAQGRIQLWGEGLVEFHGAPFFGIGQGNLADETGHVTHNSYIHAYAELGFFGGTLFVGGFYLATVGLAKLRPGKAPELPAELRILRLCLLPVLAAYLMGIYSLSRTYGNATYMIFGVIAAFLALAAAAGAPMPSLSFRIARRLAIVSVLCIVYFEVFVRVFGR